MPNTQETTEHGVRVAERVISVPLSVSKEAQDMLRAAVGEDGVPLNSRHQAPDPENHGAWRQFQKSAEAHYAESIQGLANGSSGDVQSQKIGCAVVHVATPKDLKWPDCVCIDLHGGALVVGGGEACKENARMNAERHGMVCFGVDYRMPPDHPFPTGLDDCMAVYKVLLARYGADRIVFNGRSAGGNLAMATILRAQEEDLPLPAVLILLSPQIDLTESGDSFRTNETIDVVLPGSLMSNNLLYAGGADLADPHLSPLFGDIPPCFPPTFVQSGTRDLFLSNAVRLHRKLRRAKIDVELAIFEAMPHGGFGGAPEDAELAAETVRFVSDHLPRTGATTIPERPSDKCGGLT